MGNPNPSPVRHDQTWTGLVVVVGRGRVIGGRVKNVPKTGAPVPPLYPRSTGVHRNLANAEGTA